MMVFPARSAADNPAAVLGQAAEMAQRLRKISKVCGVATSLAERVVL